MKVIAIDEFLKSVAPILKEQANTSPKWYKEQIEHIQDQQFKNALASYLKEA